MLSRRLLLHATTKRLFSTSPVFSKFSVPSIGKPQHSDENTARFRESVIEFRLAVEEKAKADIAAKKAQEAEEKTAAARAAGIDPAEKSDAPKGIVQSILYGSDASQEQLEQMEMSYSQKLARGKYVHAIEIHKVKPDKLADYVNIIGDCYPKIAATPSMRAHLVGSWKTEVGDTDTFVHIWEYLDGYAGYHTTVNEISKVPAIYDRLYKELPSLIHERRTDLMQEFEFWSTAPPRKLGGIFELRSYTLQPGRLLAWESAWRQGLDARRRVMEGVGAWFTQIGQLNHVHYLWQFPDLRARQLAREKSWNEKGWSSTVHQTVPLIKKMESRIMVPCEWSPIG